MFKTVRRLCMGTKVVQWCNPDEDVGHEISV